MARTVLQIAAAAFGELGLPALGQIAGSAMGDAAQVLSLLNREGLELADIDGGWPAVRGEQIITLVPGQEAYPFPADIAYYRDATSWDRSTHWQVAGPLSDRAWQRIRSGIAIASPYIRYRIMNGMMHFDPVPTGTDTIVFEYTTNAWAADTNGAPKAFFTADTDVPLLPEDLFVLGLKWRFLAAKGMNYAEERAVYDAAVQRKHSRAEVSTVLPLNARAPRYVRAGDALIPEGNWPGR